MARTEPGFGVLHTQWISNVQFIPCAAWWACRETSV